MKPVARLISAALCIISLFGCTEKKNLVIENMNMVPHCIGRLIVDLPEEFTPHGGATAIIIPRDANSLSSKMEIEVVSVGINQQQFESAVASRKLELAKGGTDTENALKTTFNEPDGGILFRILKVGNGYIGELDKLVGKAHIRISAVSYDGTFERVERDIVQFASAIVPVDASKPSDFCLGAVSVGGINLEETAQFYFGSTQRPDLSIEINIDTFQPDKSQPLLARMSNDGSLLNIFDIKHRALRKNELRVAGMRAQEWLGVANLGAQEGTEYNFTLETLRKVPSPLNPAMQIQMMSGQYDKNGVKHPNSLDDGSALQLWDAIVRSIRTAPTK